jgi:transcriptional regulator of acetoin/glycerol metabolism
MEKKIKELIADKKQITALVRRLDGVMNKEDVAKMLGISRATLFVRLRTHNWNLNEINIIIEKLRL